MDRAANNFKSKNQSKKRSRNYQGRERYHGCSSPIFVQAKEQGNTKLLPFVEKGNKNYNGDAHEMKMTKNKNKHKIS